MRNYKGMKSESCFLNLLWGEDIKGIVDVFLLGKEKKGVDYR